MRTPHAPSRPMCPLSRGDAPTVAHQVIAARHLVHPAGSELLLCLAVAGDRLLAYASSGPSGRRHQHEVLSANDVAHRTAFLLNRALAHALDQGYRPWGHDDAHPFAHESATPPYRDHLT